MRVGQYPFCAPRFTPTSGHGRPFRAARDRSSSMDWLAAAATMEQSGEPERGCWFSIKAEAMPSELSSVGSTAEPGPHPA